MSAECVVGVYVGSMKAVAVRAKVEAGGNYRSVSASSRGVSTSAPSPSRIHEASPSPSYTYTARISLLGDCCVFISLSSIYLLCI